MFDHILNWKLKAGSHPFPGPDGGTCINEAALVAAGFEYREINIAHDMPGCFSRVIAGYALYLNDHMPDDIRGRLLPFVGRLAGTYESEKIEIERAEYLALQAVNVFAAKALDEAGQHNLASECRNAVTLLDAFEIVDEAKYRVENEVPFEPLLSVVNNTRATVRLVLQSQEDQNDKVSGWALSRVVSSTAYVALAAARGCFWNEAITALDGVLAIGKQAEPLDVNVIQCRLETAKEEAVHG